jgi:hypothetical protein
MLQLRALPVSVARLPRTDACCAAGPERGRHRYYSARPMASGCRPVATELRRCAHLVESASSVTPTSVRTNRSRPLSRQRLAQHSGREQNRDDDIEVGIPLLAGQIASYRVPRHNGRVNNDGAAPGADGPGVRPIGWSPLSNHALLDNPPTAPRWHGCGGDGLRIMSITLWSTNRIADRESVGGMCSAVFVMGATTSGGQSELSSYRQPISYVVRLHPLTNASMAPSMLLSLLCPWVQGESRPRKMNRREMEVSR